MSMKLMALTMDIRVGNPLRKLVLLKLADNANDKGECFPSYQHIADQCEITKRSVINHVKALVKQGFLKINHRKTKTGNSSNLFLLNISALRGEPNSLPSETDSPHSEPNSLGGSEPNSPRTSHSFEPINEPCVDEAEKPDIADGVNPDELTNTHQQNNADNQKRFKAIVAVFNDVFADSPVRKVSLDAKAANKKRMRLVPNAWKLAKQRVHAWEESGEIQQATSADCLEWFRLYFESCKADPFINGTNRSKGHENWKPDFEYLLRPEVLEQRVLEAK